MTHKVPFSELPGRHERHFRRKLGNTLLPRPIGDFSDDDLLNVQRLDHEELVAFIEELKGLVVKAVNLPPNVDSEVILTLKEQLDRAYETSAGLADDQSGNQAAIRDLTRVIMKVVAGNAEGDPVASEELAQEEGARSAHYQLLEQPLVADLLHPQSLIEPDELVPLLLGEAEEGVAVALQLFDASQLAIIVEQARLLVTNKQKNSALAQRLILLEERLAGLTAGDVN